jgi:hypothetical protein
MVENEIHMCDALKECRGTRLKRREIRRGNREKGHEFKAENANK